MESDDSKGARQRDSKTIIYVYMHCTSRRERVCVCEGETGEVLKRREVLLEEGR